MVFVLQSEKSEIYSAIQKKAAASVCSVLIFVAPTVDALCALKILVHMFRTDFIPFKIIPVSGIQDLTACNEELIQGHDDIRTIIMIGCGGIVDLSEFLSVSEEITIYVFDNNRPFHLNNIFSNVQVTIIDDGYIEENKADLEDAYKASLYQANANAAGEDLDDFLSDEEHDDELEDENELNTSNVSSPGKRKLAKTSMRLCLQKYQEYAECFWTGYPLSAALFDMCQARGCSNNDLLWYAITGITDLYLRCSLVERDYTELLGIMRKSQELLNPNVVQADNSAFKALSEKNTFVNSDGIISSENDMKFVLMRHWTLYNSMLHSDFVASRLSAWREKGRKQLELLLAKIGFALNQCKSDYSAMDLEYRELLPIQLEKFAEEFNLQKYSFPSFTRDYGYLLKVSAADCVHALRSIIECPAFVSLSRATASLNENIPIWKSNFLFAFDAIDYKNTEHLKTGIDLAIKQHVVLFKEASTILSHRMIRLSKSFRYVVLKTGVDLEWLYNTATLRRLANFLINSTKNIRKGSALPLVLAVWNSLRDTFLVVARDGESYFDDPSTYKSIVGTDLNIAAQAIGARVKMDSFDLNCIEVKSSDLKSFIKSLQSVISSAN